MDRRTVVVEGPLAFRTKRIAAAHRGELGLQIFTLPLLASRLAGGFYRPARSQDLDPAIRAALDRGGFAELEDVRQFPGTTRSISRTLAKVWHADLALEDMANRNGRLADLAEIERRIRANLPRGVLSPRDLRDAALGRVAHAPATLGPIEVDRLAGIAPVWRPLLTSLADVVPLTWRNPGTTAVSWFPGQVVRDDESSAETPSIVSCANPRAEVVESLRWMRELIGSGRARPEEIAICATATESWDDHFLVLAKDAELPLHFSHGLPALASREGQSCAALADALIHGLSQDRIRRLFGFAAGGSRALAGLPAEWSLGLTPGAALFELDQWRRAFDEAAGFRKDGIDPRPTVMPVLELIVRGPEAAEQLGSILLNTPARAIWTEALRRAPAEALEFSLRDLRLPDGRDPGASTVWCPASHLAGAPRPWVRLLGLNSRSWPRNAMEDPLIPAHIMPHHMLDPDPVTEQDRRAFVTITGYATRGCILSRSRRNAQGGRLAASPLVSQGHAKVLKRARIPQHAFSDSDRLLARPNEALSSPVLAAADLCWRNWRSSPVTAHDGQVRPDHPQIAHALGKIQSATSLRLLLRDPLAFVWRYALGWHTVPDDDQPLTLDARAYGELVHELLKSTVDRLEPIPGYARASRKEIESALMISSEMIRVHWPLKRSVPPALLWQHTLDKAGHLALKALTLDEAFQPTTRSWTELGFGRDADGGIAQDLPWPPNADVEILGTGVRIQGSIDRLDLTNGGLAARVSDYKTGTAPRLAEDIVLHGGAELQRVIYAMAVRQLLPQNSRVVARLVFLGDEEPKAHRLPNVDQAIAELGLHIDAALALLRKGIALPGPDSKQDQNDFRLALPSSPSYLQIKNASFMCAFGEFVRIWSCR